MLRRLLLAMLTVAVVGTGLSALPAVAADEPVCELVPIKDTDPVLFECRQGGGSGTPGTGGGSNEPSCDLTEAPYVDGCDGTAACEINNPAKADGAEEQIGTPKPSEDHHPAFKFCKEPGGGTYFEWYWTTDGEEPTIAERARTALSALSLPTFNPTFNPPVATLVNLETWWWAEGAPEGDISSPPALGVVAIATPVRMEVDPGDGSAVMNCPLSNVKSDECSHVYRKGSYKAAGRTADGKAAFAARMRIVYDIRFELDGDAVEVAGLPADLSTDWQQQAIPVREAQSLVVPGSR